MRASRSVLILALLLAGCTNVQPTQRLSILPPPDGVILILNEEIAGLSKGLVARPNEVVAAGWYDRVYGENWVQPDGVSARVTPKDLLAVLSMKYPGREIRLVLFRHPWTA